MSIESIPLPTHPRFVDRRGFQYGRLTVVRYMGSRNKKTLWRCMCVCGNANVVSAANLSSGQVKSCGCLLRDTLVASKTTHGMRQSREYSTWCSMRDRCNNPNSERFSDYGGRNIQVDARWDHFANFYADMGEKPSGYTLERVNNDLGYSPDNCIWANSTTQNRNKRVRHDSTTGINGVTLRASGKYVARMAINGKRTHLGTFTEKWDAICARKSAELTHWR